MENVDKKTYFGFEYKEIVTLLLTAIVPIFISGWAVYYTYGINNSLEKADYDRSITKLAIMKILSSAKTSQSLNDIRDELERVNTTSGILEDEIKKSLYEMLAEETVLLMGNGKYETKSFNSRYDKATVPCSIKQEDIFKLLVTVENSTLNLYNIATEYQKLYGTTCFSNQREKILDTLYHMLNAKVIFLDSKNSIRLYRNNLMVNKGVVR